MPYEGYDGLCEHNNGVINMMMGTLRIVMVHMIIKEMVVRTNTLDMNMSWWASIFCGNVEGVKKFIRESNSNNVGHEGSQTS